MRGYYLFRRDQLIDKVTDPNSLGAGHLYDLGQLGDRLVYVNEVHTFEQWAWKQGTPDGRIRCWDPLDSLPEIEANHYRTLILLQG